MTDISITKNDVLKAQQEWADGIVDIGAIFLAKGDYQQRASRHIKDLYAFDGSEVMFKPTLASDVPFRKTFNEALSYFIGGEISEDNGFAITPWSKVRFGEQQIVLNNDSALAMGHYFFTRFDNNQEIKVEFTFGYVRSNSGNLIINLHHSSLPFTP